MTCHVAFVTFVAESRRNTRSTARMPGQRMGGAVVVVGVVIIVVVVAGVVDAVVGDAVVGGAVVGGAVVDRNGVVELRTGVVAVLTVDAGVVKFS